MALVVRESAEVVPLTGSEAPLAFARGSIGVPLFTDSTYTILWVSDAGTNATATPSRVNASTSIPSPTLKATARPTPSIV